MNSKFASVLLDGEFGFQARPVPVAGDLRLLWGVTLVLLIINSSRGGRADFKRVHFLAHAARTNAGKRAAYAALENEGARYQLRVEPWVNRAINYAAGAQLLDIVKGRTIKLSAAGLAAVRQILEAESVMREEKSFLAFAAPKLTAKRLARLMDPRSFI